MFITVLRILFACVQIKKFTAAQTVHLYICSSLCVKEAQMFITCLLGECGVGIATRKQWREKKKLRDFYCKEIIFGYFSKKQATWFRLNVISCISRDHR